MSDQGNLDYFCGRFSCGRNAKKTAFHSAKGLRHMTGTKLVAAALAWFALALAAIVNGVFRTNVILPYTGEPVAHRIGTATFIILVLLITYIAFRVAPVFYTKRELLLIGCAWLIVTVLFEFGFGHYIAKHSWERLFADYNIMNGRVWLFALITVGVAPVLVGKKEGGA